MVLGIDSRSDDIQLGLSRLKVRSLISILDAKFFTLHSTLYKGRKLIKNL